MTKDQINELTAQISAASPLFDESEADAALETLLNFADERGFRCLEDNFDA